MNSIPVLAHDQVTTAISIPAAVEAIETALRAGLDPAADIPRSYASVGAGQLLIMPSESRDGVGVKLLTLAPDNPRRGMPRIQGFYLLFDSATLAPRAILDGGALTTIRTPAVSIAAVRRSLLRSRAPLDIVVFGTGPQGRAHADGVESVLAGHREIGRIVYVARSETSSAPIDADVVVAGSAAASEALADAGLVICATTSRTPLFDSAVLRSDVVVVAVSSHEADPRELDSSLMGRAQVVVEDPATAMRECGDVVMAIAEGTLDEQGLIHMSDVIAERELMGEDAPVVFKSSGMAWEDLVVAQAIVAAAD